MNSLTTFFLILAIALNGANGIAQSEMEIWEHLRRSTVNNSPRHTLGLIKARKNANIERKELCILNQIEVLALSSVCPADYVQKRAAIYKIDRCQSKYTDSVNEIIKNLNSKHALNSKREKDKFVSALKSAKRWKVHKVTGNLMNNVQADLNPLCGEPEQNEFTVHLADDSNSVSFLRSIEFLGESYDSEKSFTCENALTKSSDALITEFSEKISKRVSRETLVNLSFRTKIAFGDCYLEQRKFAEAVSDYESAKEFAQNPEHRLFVEHKVNWLTLNLDEKSILNRADKLVDLLNANKNGTALYPTLVMDLVEFAAKSNFELARTSTYLTNDLTDTDRNRIFGKIIRYSKTRPGFSKRVNNWTLSQPAIAKAYYLASASERIDPRGQLDGLGESCGILNLIPNFVTHITPSEREQLMEYIFADYVSCSLKGTHKESAHKLPKTVFSKINYEKNPRLLGLYIDSQIAVGSTSREICDLAAQHVGVLASYTKGPITEKSVKACLNSQTGKIVSKSPGIVLSRMLHVYGSDILNLIDKRDLHEKTESSNTWLRDYLGALIGNRSIEHFEVLKFLIVACDRLFQNQYSAEAKVVFAKLYKLRNLLIQSEGSVAQAGKGSIESLLLSANPLEYILNSNKDSGLYLEFVSLGRWNEFASLEVNLKRCQNDYNVDTAIACSFKTLSEALALYLEMSSTTRSLSAHLEEDIVNQALLPVSRWRTLLHVNLEDLHKKGRLSLAEKSYLRKEYDRILVKLRKIKRGNV